MKKMFKSLIYSIEKITISFMKKIKNYETFCTEELNLKTLAAGAALTAGLVIGSPNISSKGEVSMVQTTNAQNVDLSVVENDFNHGVVKTYTMSPSNTLNITSGFGVNTQFDVLDENGTGIQDHLPYSRLAGNTDFILYITYLDNPEPSNACKIVVTIDNGTNVSNASYNDEFTIYPNPTTDVINIKSDKVGRYEIIDISGKVLKNTSDKSIDVSDLPSGKYFLRTGNLTKTFIKN